MLNLKPAKVFYYFNEITKIPRPSKREEKMSIWLEETGKKLGDNGIQLAVCIDSRSY